WTTFAATPATRMANRCRQPTLEKQAAVALGCKAVLKSGPAISLQNVRLAIAIAARNLLIEISTNNLDRQLQELKPEGKRSTPIGRISCRYESMHFRPKKWPATF